MVLTKMTVLVIFEVMQRIFINNLHRLFWVKAFVGKKSAFKDRRVPFPLRKLVEQKLKLLMNQK